MKRMLINATQYEELRVAIVDGQSLENLGIGRPGQEQEKGNIYKAVVEHIEVSLDAAFVNYGQGRHGFLPFKEVAPNYYHTAVSENSRPSIKEVLKEGQEIIVQVDKERRGNKGAALTTFISLAGSYLVLMPNNPRAGGISRRIEGDDRSELREQLTSLDLPTDMGLIIRTAGVGKSQDELQWDLTILLKYWDAISVAAQERPAPFLIHQESDVVIRAVRDHLCKDTNEILIDSPSVYEKVREYIQHVRPDYLQRVKLYKDHVPLFNRFHIESQIEAAFQREVRLPSGGAIVIDHTEALVSIDINSARATRGGDIEETALNTNIEAAEEIARQLRLRDLGGLIVIDFIDMTPTRNQREVENRLREALKMDRARVQVGRISRFGLLEMSRQRLRSSLGETTQGPCPRCSGRGNIRSVESLSLSVMRLIEEEAMKEKTAQIRAQLPVDVATFLLNEKRQAIGEIEQRHQVSVVLIPNEHFETPQYRVDRIKKEELQSESEILPSYQLMQKPEQEVVTSLGEPIVVHEPAVKGLSGVQAPRKTSEGFIKRLITSLFGSETAELPTTPRKSATPLAKKMATKQPHRSSGKRPRHGHDREQQARFGRRSRNEQRHNRSGGGQRHQPRVEESQNETGSEYQQKTEQRHPRHPRHEQAASQYNESRMSMNYPMLDDELDQTTSSSRDFDSAAKFDVSTLPATGEVVEREDKISQSQEVAGDSEHKEESETSRQQRRRHHHSRRSKQRRRGHLRAQQSNFSHRSARQEGHEGDSASSGSDDVPARKEEYSTASAPRETIPQPQPQVAANNAPRSEQKPQTQEPTSNVTEIRTLIAPRVGVSSGITPPPFPKKDH